MCRKMYFNSYTMTGRTPRDTELIDAYMMDAFDSDYLTMDENGRVEAIDGELIAHGKMVSVGDGIYC